MKAIRGERTGPLAALLVGWRVVAGCSAESSPQPPPAPDPFSLEAVCPDPRRAAHEGDALDARAVASWERAGLDARAAMDALELSSQALACIELGGDPAAARDARERHASWEQRLRNEWALRRLRLSRALADPRRDSTRVRDAASGVLAMLARSRGTYARWLRDLGAAR